MKRILSIVMGTVMLLGAFALVACGGGQEAALKFGMGVYTDVTAATSADADVEGQGNVVVTVAAITVDADNKVVACRLDTVDCTVKYTAEGKAIANDGFKTKAEQGTNYGMVAWGGAAKEWFEQAEAFENLVAGKTLAEIKALVAEGNKGTADVENAGCTIKINEFVNAIEKAFANLADSTATASSAVKVGMHVEQVVADASEEKNGSNELEITAFAAAVDAEGKVLVAASDCVQIAFTFDVTGASTYDLAKAVSSKREAGANYGMVAWGGAAKEWFEQADAFNALCVGKTATEVAALCANDNYGTDAVKSAGCTIKVNGLAKAAAKIG